MSGAGRISGALPKPADKRARTNKDTFTPLRVVHVTPTPQPDLPDDITYWHAATIRWWNMWKDSALAREFTDAEWSYLIETAFIHTRFYEGDMRMASELRLRAAKFGVTPEDRARLRIQVITADEAEAKAEAHNQVPSSRGLYSAPPKVV